MASAFGNIHAQLNNAGAKFMSILNMKMFEETKENQTSFIWVTGKYRDIRVGTPITSLPFTAGGHKWRCMFYPKGFTRQDYASLYLVSLDGSQDDCPDDWKCFVQFDVLWKKKSVKVLGKKRPQAAGGKGGVQGTPDPDGKSAAGSVKSGSKAGSKAGSKVGSQAGSQKSGSKAGSQAGSQAASLRPSQKSGGSKPPSVAGSRAGSAKSSHRSGGSDSGSVDGEEGDEEDEEGGGGGGAAAAAGEETGGGGKAPGAEEDWKKFKSFSMMYTKKKNSWGFQDLINLQDLFNPKAGWMTQASGDEFTEGVDPKTGERIQHNAQDGRLELKLVITAIGGIATEIEKAEERTKEGRTRVTWIIHNFHMIHKKLQPNQKISSEEFASDGTWYFDFYPKGYDPDIGKKEYEELSEEEKKERAKWMSLFVHSGSEQAKKGEVKKQMFSLGLIIQSNEPSNHVATLQKLAKSADPSAPPPPAAEVYRPGDTEIVCNITTIYRGLAGSKTEFSPRVYGKKMFKHIDDFNANNRYLSGDYRNGGDVYFILDMLETSEANLAANQQMLLPLSARTECKECKTNLIFPWSRKVNCHQCGEVFCYSCTKDQARLPEYGYERGRRQIVATYFNESGATGYIRAQLGIAKNAEAAAAEKYIDEFDALHDAEPVDLEAEFVRGGPQLTTIPDEDELYARNPIPDDAAAATAPTYTPAPAAVTTIVPKKVVSILDGTLAKKGVDVELDDTERQKMETAVFEKPVCTKCAETLRTKSSLQCIRPSPGYNEKQWKPEKPLKRRGWTSDGYLKPLDDAQGAQQRQATAVPQMTQRHAIVLARGGEFIEPMVQYKKCPGVILNEETSEYDPCGKEFNGLTPKAHCRSCARPFCMDCLKQIDSMKELDIDSEGVGGGFFAAKSYICKEFCEKERAFPRVHPSHLAYLDFVDAEKNWKVKAKSKEPEKKVVEKIVEAAAPPPEEKKEKPIYKRLCPWIKIGDDEDEDDDEEPAK